MSNAAKITVGVTSPIEVGASSIILAALSGVLSQFKNTNWTPQNLANCVVNADGSIGKSIAGNEWNSGCTSVETLTAGNGSFWFVANLPPNEIASPFGGRQFFAGLTTKTNVTTFADIEFGIQAFEGGVMIYENGVQKRNPRAARNNAVYSVGVENGQIIYRADNEIIYRSAQTFSYPLRVGVAFYNANDRIGGNSNTNYSFAAFDQNNASAGSFTTLLGQTTWNAPNAKGRYRIRVNNALSVVGYSEVEVLKRMPWGLPSGLPCPTKWMQLPPEFVNRETVFDDEGSEINSPYAEPVRRWRIEYATKLNQTQAAILDNFWLEHRGWALPFYFFDEREGVLYDNVRFERQGGYTRDHTRIWAQSRTIQMIRRPL